MEQHEEHEHGGDTEEEGQMDADVDMSAIPEEDYEYDKHHHVQQSQGSIVYKPQSTLLQELMQSECLESPPSLSGSPRSEDSHLDFKDPEPKDSSRKRKILPKRFQKVRAVSPGTGLEGPLPDDGFSWIKYGQKEILGAKYPRCYYRCDHRNCLVKKKVERSNEDPSIVEVTYRGWHTCTQAAASHLTPPPAISTEPNDSIDMEGPLLDGFSWSKYGQKEIPGAKYPRRYYRCDHRNCLAKKKVQRSNEDPSIVEVTYRGWHTCTQAAASHLTPPPAISTEPNDSIDMEGPLLDGFSWSKYGQKEIPGAKYPRRYYRCDHRNCLAKKHVQRSNEDPSIVEVTYRGWHTCTQAAASRLTPPPAISTEPNDSIDISHADAGDSSSMCQTLHDPEPKDSSRKRKILPKCIQKVTMRAVSPGTGLEGPLPDDGFSWIKYGHKEILGAKYPRSYYRCTHRHAQACLALKQVQRLDEDPSIIEVTYTGCHTCTQAAASHITPPPEILTEPSDSIGISHAGDSSPMRQTLHDLLSEEEKETYQKIKQQFNKLNRIKDFLLLMLSSPMPIPYKAIYEDVVQDISKIYGKLRKLEADLISKDTHKWELVKIDFQILSKRIQRMLDDSFLDEIEIYIPRNMVEKICKSVQPDPQLEAAVPGKLLEASSSTSSAPVERIETRERKIPEEILELAVRSAVCQISEYIRNQTFQNIRVYGRGECKVLLLLEDNLQQIYKYSLPIFMVNVSYNHSNSQIGAHIARRMGYKSTELCKILERSNFLLLLDGIHERIDLCEAGIPLNSGHGAIVFTTGSHEISPNMKVDVGINMEDHLLAWKLFCEIVGEFVHSSNVQHMAISIFKNCGGHMLAIVLMAKYLKNVTDVEIWKDALHKLTSLIFDIKGMNRVVGTAIALIWEKMSIPTKHCIKYCTMHPKRTWFNKISLISDWIKDGIIHKHDEGKYILEDLTCAFLLENIGKGESVMLQEEVHDIFVHLHQLIFSQGSLEDKEWGDFREIHLMCNDLSDLPESPNCPLLLKLFLQNNHDLIEIPSSFFEHMPALQVLDLSYTSIKNLPHSLSHLVALRKFLLRGCELFMNLPPHIGELKNLEELDLDKTEIIHLPTEIGNLEKMKVLKVSFYGYMNGSKKSVQLNQKIPLGVISNLSQLAELSIDVNPDDEQWDLTMEVISREVKSLKMLKTLRLYMPEAELLNKLTWNRTFPIYPSLSHFSFIVGRHKQRIIVRVPREVEAEFDKWDKCLKFVYGENIPNEIQEVLRYATAFFLDRHMYVTKLSEFGIENVKNLRFCILAECNQLQMLVDGEECVLESLQYLNIYYMRDLESIYKGSIPGGCLSHLKFLELHTCPQLSTIFTPDLLRNLINLEEIVIEDCPQVSSLLVSHASFNLSSDKFFLPSLKRMSLLYLPELVSITCSSVYIAPKLERIGFYNCPKLIRLSTKDLSSENLMVIKGEKSWWEALRWDESEWGGRPTHLDFIFSSIIKEEDVMTQLENDGIYFNIQNKNESILNSQAFSLF